MIKLLNILSRDAISLGYHKQNENKTCTCQKHSCGRTFANPLKILDLHANSSEIYDGCPYCLSRMLPGKPKIGIHGRDKSGSSRTRLLCSYHFGYLCERTVKVAIPDECTLCKDLISCMLKNLGR